jgi:hypothetical protein
MTTIDSETVQCGVCGEDSEQVFIGSTNQFGYRDLDTRPPEMERSTMMYWLQECPNCGFVAPSLSEVPDGAKGIVNEADFRRLNTSDVYSGLIAVFMKHAYISDKLGSKEDKAWAYIRAAWAADDEGKQEIAQEARILAASELVNLKLVISASHEAGVIDLLITDLWRRSGKWEHGTNSALEGLEVVEDPWLKSALQFEIVLMNKLDDQAYTSESVPSLEQ